MKKALVLALAGFAAGGAAYGQYSVSTDITFASEYIFRGVKLSDNTLHPSVEFSQDQMYAGFWAALPINNRDGMGYVDEYDFYLGFSPKLSDTLTLDAGVTYYYYPNGNVDESLEAYIGVTADWAGLTPSLYAYYDFDLEAYTVQGSFGYSIPLQGIGSSLDLSATLGFVNPQDVDSWIYYGVGATVPYKLNDNATVKAGLQWVRNDIEGIEDDNFLLWTVGLTVGF